MAFPATLQGVVERGFSETSVSFPMNSCFAEPLCMRGVAARGEGHG